MPPAQKLSPLTVSWVLFAGANSLMDKMKYPVLREWITAQVQLSLTASNALVSVLNEVLRDSESFLSFYSPMALASLSSYAMSSVST